MEMHPPPSLSFFVSAALWKAGAWRGPKVTVVEMCSNVSPTARAQKQGHFYSYSEGVNLSLKKERKNPQQTSQDCQIQYFVWAHNYTLHPEK